SLRWPARGSRRLVARSRMRAENFVRRSGEAMKTPSTSPRLTGAKIRSERGPPLGGEMQEEGRELRAEVRRGDEDAVHVARFDCGEDPFEIGRVRHLALDCLELERDRRSPHLRPPSRGGPTAAAGEPRSAA